MLRLISRIRERDGILGFAQLVGIKYNQTIIGKIFAQLRRELLEGAVVRNGSPTCAYHYKQMVVIHLPGQYQQIPQSSRREKSVKVCPYFSSPMPATVQLFPRLQRNVPGSPTYRPSGKNAPPTSESLLRIPPWEERL